MKKQIKILQKIKNIILAGFWIYLFLLLIMILTSSKDIIFFLVGILHFFVFAVLIEYLDRDIRKLKLT